MDKLQKVVRLHRLLRTTHYCVRLPRILEDLDCTPPTFYRIKAFMLKHLQAPIIFDANRGGYRYAEREGERFELPGFWLTKNELEAVLCFQNAVERLHQGYFAHALAPMRHRVELLLEEHKLHATALRDRVKIIPLASRQVDEGIFRTLVNAVVASRRLLIEHASPDDDSPTRREISPQSLIRYRDNWYLDAFCHLRNALRSFSVDRITRAETSKKTFRKIPHEELETFFAGAYGIYNGPPTRTAKILFKAAAARQVSREEWHPQQKGQFIEDETYELTIPYGHSRELIMDILRWGELAQVLDPPELQEEVRSQLEKALGQYGK